MGSLESPGSGGEGCTRARAPAPSASNQYRYVSCHIPPLPAPLLASLFSVLCAQAA